MAKKILGSSVTADDQDGEQPPPDILWYCHIRGPDDVYAAPDYETALAWADTTNAMNWRGPGVKIEPPVSWDDCLLKAVPALWTWSAEEHAEDLPKSIAAFSRPICPHGPCPTFTLCRYGCKEVPAATPVRQDAGVVTDEPTRGQDDRI